MRELLGRSSFRITDCKDGSGEHCEVSEGTAALLEYEAMVLMAITYFPPITRGDLSKIFGKEVSRDTSAAMANGAL